jgi:hypothetical protein
MVPPAGPEEVGDDVGHLLGLDEPLDRLGREDDLLSLKA